MKLEGRAVVSGGESRTHQPAPPPRHGRQGPRALPWVLAFAGGARSRSQGRSHRRWHGWSGEVRIVSPWGRRVCANSRSFHKGSGGRMAGRPAQGGGWKWPKRWIGRPAGPVRWYSRAGSRMAAGPGGIGVPAARMSRVRYVSQHAGLRQRSSAGTGSDESVPGRVRCSGASAAPWAMSMRFQSLRPKTGAGGRPAAR